MFLLAGGEMVVFKVTESQIIAVDVALCDFYNHVTIRLNGLPDMMVVGAFIPSCLDRQMQYAGMT